MKPSKEHVSVYVPREDSEPEPLQFDAKTPAHTGLGLGDPSHLVMHMMLENPHTMESPVTSDSETGSTKMSSDEGDHALDGMTLVSPPFTPTQSVMDLTTKTLSDPRLGRRPTPEVETVDSAEKVRSKLEELPQVHCESRARIPTTAGTEMFLHVYSNNVDKKEHLAIVFGEDIHSKTLFEHRPGDTDEIRMTRGAYTGRLYPGRTKSMEPQEKYTRAKKDTLVRIHSECYTGETAWSARCDCGEQLDEAARLMALEGQGCIVYLRQEGRGIGLGEKLKAYNLQDLGADTVQANLMLKHPADARSFAMATAILCDLGLDHVRLLTNNPDKIAAVEGKHGEVHVTQRVPMVPLSWQKKGGFSSKEVDRYLETKVQRMGHLLDLAH